jgi:hypothetical protein
MPVRRPWQVSKYLSLDSELQASPISDLDKKNGSLLFHMGKLNWSITESKLN